MATEVEWLSVPNGRLGLDPVGGAIASLELTKPELAFVRHGSGRGLLRLAAPLPGYAAHYVEVGTHGAAEVGRREDGLRLRYPSLATAEGPVPVAVEIDLTPTNAGLVMQAQVENRWTETIPQIVFPQIFGLGAVGEADDTRLQLGRGRLHPFRELTLPADSAHFLDLGLYKYYGYGFSAFNMKWLDYGGADGGFSLFARDPRYDLQGLLVDRPDRVEDVVDLRWLHYPYVEPGERWESAEFVLLPHPGEWFAGARAYQDFAATAFPYRAPERVREALGFRSIWLSYWNAPPMYRFDDLPELAAEMEGLDLAEMSVWGWMTQFGYPMEVDTRLGSAAELAEGMRRSGELGVPISLFTTHHLVEDRPETDPAWLHLNAAGQRELSNWTYNRDFLPRFGPLFSATHSCVMASALSPGWRATGLENYRRLLELGTTSICFDQFFPWNEPNLNPERDGRPGDEGEKLLEFGERARELILAGHADGTFSGEGVADASVPALDYPWEWCYGHDLADSGPFRYVFPQYRLSACVNEHPRGAILTFVEGGFLNVMPRAMERRLRDFPELVETLRKLGRLRRRFLEYFTQGQFHFQEGLAATGCLARLYCHAGNILVLVTNPSDEAAEIAIEIDPAVVPGASPPATMRVWDLDGNDLERAACTSGLVRYATRLEADGLLVIELNAK